MEKAHIYQYLARVATTALYLAEFESFSTDYIPGITITVWRLERGLIYATVKDVETEAFTGITDYIKRNMSADDKKILIDYLTKGFIRAYERIDIHPQGLDLRDWINDGKARS